MPRGKKSAADEAEITEPIDETVTEQPEKPCPKKEKSIDPKNPNASLDLSGFDYRDLTGEKFKEYNDMAGKLRIDGHYDFVLLKVEPVFVERYPGLPGSPKDFIGVKAKTDIPEHTTRILMGQAMNYNQQIHNDAAKRNGKYYLLKK